MADKQRIQLIDALRGLAVLLMVVHHFLYDLVAFCGAPAWLFSNPVFNFLHYIFAGLFLFLSGVSSNFSRSNVKRGLKALACALVITAVTTVMDMPIVFGVLHLLGTCMVLYGLTRRFWEKLPFWVVPVVSVVGIVLTGHMAGGVMSESRWLWMGLSLRIISPCCPGPSCFCWAPGRGNTSRPDGCPTGSIRRTARPWPRWGATAS